MTEPAADSGLDALSIELREAYARFPSQPRPRRPMRAAIRRAQSLFAELIGPLALQPAPPAAFDWRSQGVVGPARQQLPWNTCSSFAIAAVIECETRIKHRPPIAVDPGFIHTCLAHQGRVTDTTADSDAPADLLAALAAVKAQGFVLDTGRYPLPAADCPTLANRQQIGGFNAVSGAPNTRSAIATTGPVVAEMYFYQNFFDLRGAGSVYVPAPDVAGPHQHCVAIVGYGAQGWIIKNSFGPTWGDAGCCVIRYGDCGINAAPPAGLDDCRIYAISV